MKERPILFSGPMVRALLDGRKTQTRRVIDVSKALDKQQREMGFEMSAEHAVVGDLSWLAAIGGDAEGVKDLRRYQQLNVPIRHPEDKCIPWDDCGRTRLYCPYGSPGTSDEALAADRLWVKETWKPDPAYGYPPKTKVASLDPQTNILYAATLDETHPKFAFQAWRPSIFMPRWASRLTLEITSVRVERVQEISEEDAIAEGVQEKQFAIGVAQSMIGGKDYNVPNSYRGGYCNLWNDIHRGKQTTWAHNPWCWVLEFQRVENQ